MFPRTISTHRSKGSQFEVFGKEQIAKAYEESHFIDCRINAYPSYTQFKGIQRYPPNFIFADLDFSSFKDRRALGSALDSTLKTIRLKINGTPTVLWTGNGYHIYQPIEALILEQFKEFEEFEHPSTRFLRFAESYLTNEKSDPSHNPSFKSCMIRIPGTYNSKYPQGKNEIKIIQKWDGYRPPMNVLGAFHDYLVDQKIKEIKLKKRIEKRFGTIGDRTHPISWIETFLQMPVPDYRKNAVSLIFAPYLINIRNLPYDSASLIIGDWLKKCSELRSLDPNFDYKVKYSLNTSIRKLQLPIKFSTLKEKNKELYKQLSRKMQGITT